MPGSSVAKGFRGAFLMRYKRYATISKRFLERARRKFAVQMGTLALVDKITV